MSKISNNFIQQNSPDGGFLQSDIWRKFQESTGRKIFIINDNFHASIIEHILPVAGKYFYIPRGPIFGKSQEFPISNFQFPNEKGTKKSLLGIIILAKKENCGWIRIEPADEKSLELIKENSGHKIVKAPHDVQPKEIFVIGLEKSEEELLSGMKSKTRYNTRLAEKKGVVVKAISNFQSPISNEVPNPDIKNPKYYIDNFIRLVNITAKRDGIVTHPEEYYHRMFEIIPAENLKLYAAEFQGKIIAMNLMIFFGDTATYLHGASDNEHRNVMAPFLLQWRAIRDAKKQGCGKYNFGGIRSANPVGNENRENKWDGITRFKTGFSANTKPLEFPGSYDIILNPWRYNIYRWLQEMKNIF